MTLTPKKYHIDIDVFHQGILALDGLGTLIGNARGFEILEPNQLEIIVRLITEHLKSAEERTEA